MHAPATTGWSGVAEIAARQHGLITIAQLHNCGLGKGAVEHAVRTGRLHRLHQGVFAVGHRALSREGQWLAAVLACGAGALLSHRSAATAWGIRDGVGPRIDVLTEGRGRGRAGIQVHRAHVPPYERTTLRAVPITSPARTLLDLAHHLHDADQIAWALREAQFRRLYDRRLLELALHRRPQRHLTLLLDDLPAVGSPLEQAFLAKVVRRHGLPMPALQAKVAGFHVDFRWGEAQLTVEVDGSAHDQPMMRRADAVRDAVLAAAGEVVLRYRGPDIHAAHGRTASQIAAWLDLRH